MRRRLGIWLVIGAGALPSIASVLAQETEEGKEKDKEKEAAEEKIEEKPEPPKPLAFVDIANSGDGSIPGGTNRKVGKWEVDAEAGKLTMLPEPLDEGWLEFGPEIREKPSTLRLVVRAPGDGRLQSWFGGGLYGMNGFQVRCVPLREHVELVRRGAVLERVTRALEPGALYAIELSVAGDERDEEDWMVSVRVWEDGGERPEKPLIEHRAYADELLFPLAGRPCLVATPFSGEPVQFAAAEVYDGIPEFVEAEDEEESEKEE